MSNDQTEHQLIPKLLLRVSVREPHDILVSDTNYGGLKDATDKMVKILSVLQHCAHCCHLN